MQPIELPASALLAGAGRRLVSVVDEVRIREAGSPANFLVTTIPFLETETGPATPALVPLHRVISSSDAWCEADPAKGRSQEELERFLVAPDGAFKDPRTRAEAMWVTSLGIGAMHEGKNRVRFLRERCGTSAMPAMVTRLSFPDAGRLQLVRDDLPAGPIHGVILDNHRLALLTQPDLVVPLLRAYGVAEMPWPKVGPSLPEVLASSRWETRGSWTRWIDMQAVQQDLLAARTVVRGSVQDLAEVTLDGARVRGRVLAALAVAGVYAGVAALHPLDAVGAGLMALVGWLGGGALAMSAPVLRGPRRAWRPGHSAAETQRQAGTVGTN